MLEAPEGDLEIVLARHGRGRRADARLHRQRRPARRATSTARWPSRARPATSPSACSPTPTSRRAPAPTGRSRSSPPRARCSTRARPPRSSAATSRPPRGSPTSCCAAFGRALGQGTMNNVTLGTEDFTYYETIGGGQGACPDADGPSGVHVAMSNTLNTPVEALELEFPLRMVEYSIRRGIGRRRRAPRRRRRDPRGRGAGADELLAADRAPRATRRRAPTAASRRRAPGRNMLDGRSCRPRRSGAGGRGSGCGSRRRAAAGTAVPARPMTDNSALGVRPRASAPFSGQVKSDVVV